MAFCKQLQGAFLFAEIVIISVPLSDLFLKQLDLP